MTTLTMTSKPRIQITPHANELMSTETPQNSLFKEKEDIAKGMAQPSLSAISDKYAEALKSVGIDYGTNSPGILFAPDDPGQNLDPNDLPLNYRIVPADESAHPVALGKIPHKE